MMRSIHDYLVARDYELVYEDHTSVAYNNIVVRHADKVAFSTLIFEWRRDCVCGFFRDSVIINGLVSGTSYCPRLYYSFEAFKSWMETPCWRLCVP